MPLLASEQRAREELAILLLVEPGALDVEESEAGEARERERVERELRDRLVGAGVRLVVENVHRAVADLEKIDVAGEDARLVPSGSRRMPCSISSASISAAEPDRNFDGDRDAVVGEHEALQRLVPQAVVPHRRDDERGRAGREVLFLDDDEVVAVDKLASCEARELSLKQLVRAVVRDPLEKIGERREALVPRIFAQERELRPVIGEAVDLPVVQL